MALPSAKNLCPKCGGRMESGYVRGDAGSFNGIASTIRWEPGESGSAAGAAEQEARLARLPIFRFQASPRFPALLCPTCRLVEFEFTEQVHQTFP